MKSRYSHRKIKRTPGWLTWIRSRREQRGQILIIVVFAIVGLVAFVGLVVDTGLTFIGYGTLRRAVDSSALAAASQYRKDPNPADLASAAVEFLKLNNVQDPAATVYVCNDAFPLFEDPAYNGNRAADPLCTLPVKRRLVKVNASTTVHLAFLPVIGIRTVTLHATATSEAASLDIVLAIDVSESMTFDAGEQSAIRDPSICNIEDPADPGWSQCQPFNKIAKAAFYFVNTYLNDPSNVYDRVAVVPFDRKAHQRDGLYNEALHLTSDWNQVLNTIKGMRVYDTTGSGATGKGPATTQPNPLDFGACLGTNFPPNGVPCRSYPSDADLQNFCANPPGSTNWDFTKIGPTDGCFMRTGGGGAPGPDDLAGVQYVGPDLFKDPVTGNHYERAYLDFACGDPAPADRSKCGTTAVGNAFRAVSGEFDPNDPFGSGFRQESLWVVVLLTDGLTNRSYTDTLPQGYCPPGENVNGHWCQDSGSFSMFSRHCLAAADPLYNGNAFLYNACMIGAGQAPGSFGTGGLDPDLYDADDYARDMADLVAIGQQALVYTIGFGNGKGTFGEPGMGHSSPSTPGLISGLDWGEQLLTYAADIGADGLLDGKGIDDYFYAPDTTALQGIFDKIADRISTRLAK